MRVLISGAGVAGPALAWFLSRSGARVTLLEKSSSLKAIGQNIDVNGSALSVVKKMGLMDELRRLNTTEKGTNLVDTKGRIIASFPVKEGHISATSQFEILRGDLAVMLAQASMKSSDVEYKYGTTVTKVLSNDHTAVKVQLSNGEAHEYDLLVVADGQWSKTRRLCFPEEDVTVIDKGMYAVYWTIPRLPQDNDWWTIYHARGSRALTIRPDPHGTMRAMFTCMPCNEAQKKEWAVASRSDRNAQHALLRRYFADAGWQAQRLLDSMDDATDFYFQAIQQIKLSEWSKSRVVCIGDAAYAPTPLTGAGANLALLGAYVLAGELCTAGLDKDPTGALKEYERKFRPFVEEVQDVPSIFPGIAHPETVTKLQLFRAGMWVISKIAKIPGIVSKNHEGVEDKSFPLPQYECFADLNILNGSV